MSHNVEVLIMHLISDIVHCFFHIVEILVHSLSNVVCNDFCLVICAFFKTFVNTENT